MRASGLGSVRRVLRTRTVRPIAVGAVVLLVTAVAAPAITPSALALGAGQTVDLRVLLIGAPGGATDPNTAAWATGLTNQGVAYTEVNAAGALGSETVTLPTLTSSATHGLYNGVVLAGKPGDFAAGQLNTLFSYESTFGVRQLDGNSFPNPALGLTSVTDAQSGSGISGTTGTLTAAPAGLTIFASLAGPVPFDTGTFASPGTVASPLPTGATETPLLNDAAGHVLIGVFQHPTAAQAPADLQAGVAEMTVGFNYNQFQTQWLLLGPGLIDWVTAGTHLGLYRNYATIHVDDVFVPDDLWSTTTHANDFAANPMRMNPADVDSAASWERAHNFRLDMLFNWQGTDAVQQASVTDPLLAEFQKVDPAGGGKTYSSEFGWLNHTYDHAYLDAGCAPPFYIQAELNQNKNSATAAKGATAGTGGLALPLSSDPTQALGTLDSHTFVPGGHSGLANLIPGAAGAVDPPNLETAVASTGGNIPGGVYQYALTDQFNGADSTAADESSASVWSTNLTVPNNGKVTLTFNAVCHAGNYRVYRKRSTASTWSFVGNLSTPPSSTLPNAQFGEPTGNSTLLVAGGGSKVQTLVDSAASGTSAFTTPPTTEHALELPWEQNQYFPAALSAAGITAVGADASKPYPNPADNQFGIGVAAPTTVYPAAAPFPVSVGGARAVPRHPINIFYNNSTETQALDEYNTLYVDTAHGGHCVNSSTTTCLTAALTSFQQVVDSVLPGMFANMLNNDPRPTYVHQTNIMGVAPATIPATPPNTSPYTGDGILFSVLNPLLVKYQTLFKYQTTAPYQQPTLGESGTILGEQSGWATAQPPGTASTANSVAASQTGGTLTIKNNGATPVTVPVTVPVGSKIGALAFGSAYGGTLSAWQTIAAGATLTITVPFTATATQITGTVTDSVTAAPIANVCAYLYVHGGARTADLGVCSDATGKYTLPVAAAGSYDVAFIDGNGTHPTTWSGNVATQGAATAVTVTAGQASTLNATMPEITAIAGTVTDGVTAGPLANVCVYLYAHGGARTADPGVCTDATGKYTLPVAAAGSYDVAYIDGNGAHPTVWSGNVATQGTATAVTVTLGHLTTENAVMSQITAITGTVTDSVTAQPLAGVCAYVYLHGGARTADPGVCSNAQGKYQLPVAAPGSYDVAYIDSNGTHPTVWSGNVATQGTATAVTVTANHLTTENAALGEITAVTGTVTDSVSGLPLSGVCVYPYVHGGARTSDFGVCTGAAGTYVLPVAAAGSYDIAFLDSSGTHATQWATNQNFQSQANAVAVVANHLTPNTNAAMQAFGSISGTVTGTGNTATCVYADYASGPTSGQYSGVGSCTTATGAYTLSQLRPGLTYKLGFYPPGKSTPTNNWYNGAASEAAATAVTVNAGQTTSGINNANH